MISGQRARFGQLLDAGAAALEQPAGPRDPGGEDLQQACIALRKVIAVMTRYLRDEPWNPALSSKPASRPASPWDLARTDARRALFQASAWLTVGAPREPPHRRDPSWLASRLDSAALALAAGHDLLQTHFTRSAAGSRHARTEWAQVLASPAAEHAMLAEIGQLSSRLAVHGARAATRPGWRASPDSRQRLNAACQTLWGLSASVRAADDSEPLPGQVTELLRSIPPSLLPPRAAPERTESVTDLCAGATLAAERSRRAAWRSGPEASWSPAMSTASLRLLAGSSVVISHNNHVLLTALGNAQLPNTQGELHAQLVAAADATAKMRAAWLNAAHALDPFTADTRSQIGPMAASASDLALWTGRLAYDDPDWHPAQGPAADHRSSEQLAATPETVRRTINAVHHASYALEFLATAQHRQMQAASASGRILVPTHTVPDTWDIPCPFAAAPAERIDHLLDAYTDARHASVEATAKVASVAEATGAHSTVLQTAAALTDDVAKMKISTDRSSDRKRLAAIHHVDAGPVERILRDLEISDRDLLSRAADVDRIGHQLILDAAERQTPGYQRAVRNISSNVGTAATINRVLPAATASQAAALQTRDEHLIEPDPEH